MEEQEYLITQDGKPLGNGILGNTYPLNLYYAYGMENSYGIDFDPIAKNLWDVENDGSFNDEINIVKPGFNSGYGMISGLSVDPPQFLLLLLTLVERESTRTQNLYGLKNQLP